MYTGSSYSVVDLTTGQQKSTIASSASAFFPQSGIVIGGELTFAYDITKIARLGATNVIAVRVDPRVGEGHWYEGGGIYRHVWLTTLAPLHVAPWGTYVTASVPAGDQFGQVHDVLPLHDALPERVDQITHFVNRGIAIDDKFHPIAQALPDERLYCLSLPFILGQHPFHQGLTNAHEMGEEVGEELARALAREMGAPA